MYIAKGLTGTLKLQIQYSNGVFYISDNKIILSLLSSPFRFFHISFSLLQCAIFRPMVQSRWKTDTSMLKKRTIRSCSSYPRSLLLLSPSLQLRALVITHLEQCLLYVVTEHDIDECCFTDFIQFSISSFLQNSIG